MGERATQSVWMRCIIQTDFREQMDVFRWLIRDDYYRVIYILHDHDTIQDDSEVHDRIMPDGTEKHYGVGAVKPPHYHMIIRLPKKLTADTFSKRFGSYVHFQVCSDPHNYARYFLHNTFSSQSKYQYEFTDIKGDSTLIHDLLSSAKFHDQIECLQRFCDIYESCGGSAKDAIKIALASNDCDLIRSVMSHSYFYGRFICDSDTKGG